jgi:uncharacterized membrane protein YkvA (DUF1232 family)
MGRKRVSLLAALAVLAAGSIPDSSPAMTAEVASRAVGNPTTLMALDLDDQPLERHVSGFARSVLRGIRSVLRTVGWILWRAVDLWGAWLKCAAFSIGVAIIAALADGGLVNTWRAEGVGALITYSTLMLYVYVRLLFSSGMNLAPKLLLVGALIYGVVTSDVIPDSSLVPGRIEDVVLIVIAARVFVFACPEELVNAYAERAVSLKRRVLSLQRARTR